MLLNLEIRNFVIVDQLELDFADGFGALTGETGAGKSILVDALSLVLGERSDSTLVRTGCDKAEIYARFSLRGSSTARQWLESEEMLDVATPDELLLRRIIDANGRGSRSWINGVSANLSQVRAVSEHLLDIHGQHAHQSLLRADAQRELLDDHAGLSSLASEVATGWRRWREADKALQTAAQCQKATEDERQQLEWQVRELETLAFDTNEWAEIESEQKRLAHAASLIEGCHFALDSLAESEVAVSRQIDAVASCLTGLAEFDEELTGPGRIVLSIQAELSEAISSLRRYSERVELDPQRQVEVEARIAAVENCARKYRLNPTDLPQQLQAWRDRLALLEAGTDLKALTERVEKLHTAYQRQAEQLSVARQKAAADLSTDVSKIMQQLALGNGHLEIVLHRLPEGNAQGLEQIEFLVSGLSATAAKPLVRVASGGELSRISLAIQVVTSRSAQVPTLVFDEVDVGIGGGVAEIVGRLLHELGQERQILCVTHLPQVAARANWQWLVSKQNTGDATRSTVQVLDDNQRIAEIARMLGGVETTDLSKQHASEMLGFA